MESQPHRTRPALVTAALIEGPLFILFIATFPLIHSGGIGILGVIFSLPQTPGLVAAGALEGILTRLFGYARGYIGIPVYFTIIFVVQWLLVAVVVAVWRLRTPSGSWPSIGGKEGTK